jgi:hypothetical protein
MTGKPAEQMRWYDFCVALQRINEAGRAKVCQANNSSPRLAAPAGWSALVTHERLDPRAP